jgi:hypothetical protein
VSNFEQLNNDRRTSVQRIESTRESEKNVVVDLGSSRVARHFAVWDQTPQSGENPLRLQRDYCLTMIPVGPWIGVDKNVAPFRETVKI